MRHCVVMSKLAKSGFLELGMIFHYRQWAFYEDGAKAFAKSFGPGPVLIKLESILECSSFKAQFILQTV